MLVKDYQGKLISRDSARHIKGEDGTKRYYEIGVSCIKMPDGKYYRINTGKIIYDHSLKSWVFKKNFRGSYGFIDTDKMGHYSDTSREIQVNFKEQAESKRVIFDVDTKNVSEVETDFLGSRWRKSPCISEEVAVKSGFMEAIYDGLFYRKKDCTPKDFEKFSTPNIPQSERNNVYSLDDDKETRKRLEDLYDANTFKVNKDLELLARRYIPYSYGIEMEVQNGFVPARLREPLGFRTCRDGSLDGGLEFVSVPMEGGKGLQSTKSLCIEATKRTVISNKCSLHIHFGDVRRDKLYFLSIWSLLYKIQEEFRYYFPYSRTNTIREDGKVYAAMLPDLKIKLDDILSITAEDTFKTRIVQECGKIYNFLNNGHSFGETYDEEFVKATREILIKGKLQKQYCYRVQKINYTTRIPQHAIQGHKWQRPQRYYWVNFLNLFFSRSNTIEFRISEATTNFDKVLMLVLTYTAILKYAEKYAVTLSNKVITLTDIINSHYPAPLAAQILKYWEHRKNLFSSATGFRSGFKTIEQKYMIEDKNFSNPIIVG